MPRQKLNQIVDEGEEFTCLTPEEATQIAKDSISSFFKTKQYKWGGAIPDYVLHSDIYLNKVLNTTIIQGIEQVYSAMEKTGLKHSHTMIVNVLNECAKNWIPKDIAAGIMIMYFKLCEGYKFDA